MNVGEQQILDHESHGPWRTLLSTARSMVAQAEQMAGFPMHPILGGGTRLMLSLHHRISDDIDLFIRDPQWIGYLTPRLNQANESMVDAYEESAVSLKLRFETGEVDFIVAMSLLNQSPRTLAGVPFKLESMAEVLAKKLFYRGSMLTPRDLFDWWAIETFAPDEVPQQKMAALLKDRLDGIESALTNMRLSSAAHAIWHSLRTAYDTTLDVAVQFGIQQLDVYRQNGSAPDDSPLP